MQIKPINPDRSIEINAERLEVLMAQGCTVRSAFFNLCDFGRANQMGRVSPIRIRIVREGDGQ